MNFLELVPEVLKIAARFIDRLFISPRRQVKKIVKIYDVMHSILEETPIERFLIFKAHNGGGVIKPNTPIYVSVIYEDYTAPFRSVKSQYQHLPADQEYLRMLADLVTIKRVKICTEKMNDGMLKTIYKAEGVKYCEIYFLGSDRKNLYYCSCGTSQEKGWEQNDYQKGQLLIAINTLKQNII